MKQGLKQGLNNLSQSHIFFFIAMRTEFFRACIVLRAFFYTFYQILIFDFFRFSDKL
jgi:hypothetical protein